MKLNALRLLALSAALIAVGAQAQDNTQMPSSTPSSTTTQTKDQKKMAWENGVKQDCSAEIATGGVCAGKDFDSGLMDCLHKNRKSLSDGCKAAVHHRKGHGKKAAAPAGGQAPSNTPSTPAAPPAQQ